MIETVNKWLKIGEISYGEEKAESTPFVSRTRLCRRLERSADTRARFVESHINKGLAYQLRAMREARGLSQEELAELVDMPQTAISRLENPDYGKPTITTLKRLAKVHDVALVVRFVPFSKLVNWVSGTPFIEEGLASDAMAVPSFTEESEAGLLNAQRIAKPGQTAVNNLIVYGENIQYGKNIEYRGFAAPVVYEPHYPADVEIVQTMKTGVSITSNYDSLIDQYLNVLPSATIPKTMNMFQKQETQPEKAYDC